LCLEQYLLGEALAEIPPTLIVLDGSAGDEEPALVEMGAAAAEAKVGGDDEYRISGGGFERAFDARPSADAAVAPARPSVKGQRPKRKERNVFVELTKIVVGGLVGCILAPLVLWWGFKNDTLQIGPLVAPYAPWAVPEQFHGSGAPTSGDTAANTTSSRDSKGAPPAAGSPKAGDQSETGQGTNVAANQGKSGLIADLPTDVPLPSPTDPGESLTIEDPLAISPSVAPTKQGKTPRAASDIPPVNPAPFNPETSPVEPAPPTPATADKPLPTADDFAKAVHAAADGLTKVNESKGEPIAVRQQRYTDMYLAASDVGRMTTLLSTSDSDLIEHVETLKTFLTSLAADSGKVKALKSLTDLQLPPRKHDEGVLVAAVVQDFHAAGSMFECVTQSGRSLAETAIVCANNPQDFCQPGDELLVVGRVVEDPQKNIPGYEGDRPRVVLYGYSVTVPKAPTE
jgi:hypothetical protein